MSIKVSDILSLPTFHGAHVVAGKNGMDRLVSSVSVSEYTQGAQFEGIDLQQYQSGGELVLSAFFNCRNDVDAQLKNIREYHRYRVVGLVLFYVGVILPEIDGRLLNLADELDFPLIVMPREKLSLRYGEVIYEVMELILNSKLSGDTIKYDTLKEVMDYPKNQRTIEAVAQLISMRIHASVLLFDSNNQITSAAVWPSSVKVDFLVPFLIFPLNDGKVTIKGEDYHRYARRIMTVEGGLRTVVIFKRGEPVDISIVDKLAETFETAIKLWDDDRRGNSASGLVAAILRDEPYKVGKMSFIFRIDVNALSSMILICPEDFGRLVNIHSEIPEILRDTFSHAVKNMIFDLFDGCMVVMIDNSLKPDELKEICRELNLRIDNLDVPNRIICCNHISDANDSRRMYAMCRELLPMAEEIYPHCEVFTYSDMKYVDSCKRIVEEGDAAIAYNTEILNTIPAGMKIGREEFIKTLEVYFLDAECDVQKTGDIMFLHKNTIQYRIKKVKEYFPSGLDDLTETQELFKALALNRILRGDH